MYVSNDDRVIVYNRFHGYGDDAYGVYVNLNAKLSVKMVIFKVKFVGMAYI